MPGIGNFGSTGRPTLCDLTIEQCVDGFELFDDPLLAQAAHFLAGADSSKLHGFIFDPDPELVRECIEQVISERGPLKWKGFVTGRETGIIRTNKPVPDGVDLAGLFISVINANDRDACYRIESVRREGATTLIDVGENDFIRGMADNLDDAKGHRCDFEPRQPFRVVLNAFREWS